MDLPDNDDMTTSQPKFIDLFAGIGGIRSGFEQAGMQCVYTSEKDEHAQKIYTLNYGDAPDGDITAVDPASIPEHDIILAGFPCQPFSISGQKLGFDDARGTLFFNILRIAEEKKPKVLLLENVKNLMHHDNGNTFKVIVAALVDLGYNVSHRILNARDFGVPQTRERMIIVASKDKTFDFDQVKTCKPVQLKDFLDPAGTDFEWLDPSTYTLLDDAKVKTQVSGLRFAGYRNNGTRRTAGIRPNTEHLSRAHRQQNRIYCAEGVHPTISSQEASGRFWILVNGRVRKMTLQECYRIFGFPEDFKLTGTTAECYRRIGNSVCVPMMKALADEINRQILAK